jgi:primosomal protein N' (replication factor Y)
MVVEPLVAEIAVFTPLDKPLHYLIPSSLQPSAEPGARVIAPLGRREVMGLILSISEPGPEAASRPPLRPVVSILDERPVMPADLLNLCRWMSDYYFYPVGEVFKTALPSQVVSEPVVTYGLTPAGEEAARVSDASDLLRLLAHSQPVGLEDVRSRLPAYPKPETLLKQLEREGLLVRTFHWPDATPAPRVVKTVELISPALPEKLAGNPKARELVGLLASSRGAVPLSVARSAVANADYWLRKLGAAGILRIESREEVRESHFAQELEHSLPHELTEDQKAVCDAVAPFLATPEFKPFVLQGVTGSGKTEVYLHLVQGALALRKGALVIVPEIALSTQLEAQFRRRFGPSLAVYHSGLGGSVRYDQWKELNTGNRPVLLGVRSAVFMPVSNLGLIIVDEEHDASLKQDDHLRYHGRDTAIMRARLLGIPIVLGSATPSLQSVHNVRQGRHALLALPRRIHDRPLPEVRVVDMRAERKGCRILSKPLQEAILQTVQAGSQVLLFLNRRGFSSFLLCNVCGEVIECPHCSVSLTYHQSQDHLRCHYCGWQQAVPGQCPACDHAALIRHGFGTERVEEEVRKLLPGEPIVRIDRDTVKQSSRVTEHLNIIRQARARILIGTQMIAKGHDFPNLTLVGIVNGDTGLQIPDYRSAETTVQLLMQVSGRAGRGETPGLVLLQTYNPTHYAIEAALRGDYTTFCETELEKRRSLQYPPFTRLIRFLLTDASEPRAQQAAHRFATLCREAADDILKPRGRPILVLGPSPAPLQKLSNRHRFHVLAKTWSSQDLQHFAREVLSRARADPAVRKVSLAVDRDPVHTL